MLKKLQAISGMIFAPFLTLHILNTWLAALGGEVYDVVQGGLRLVYQASPVETVLLGLGGVLFSVGNVHESAFAELAMEITDVDFAP